MSTTFSEVHTLAVGVNTITLGQQMQFGIAPGLIAHNYLRVIKHAATFDAPAEIWIDLAGGTAAQDGAGIESIPEKAAESNLMSVSGVETRSRVTATGELAISIWSSGAGDVTVEAV